MRHQANPETIRKLEEFSELQPMIEAHLLAMKRLWPISAMVKKSSLGRKR